MARLYAIFVLSLVAIGTARADVDTSYFRRFQTSFAVPDIPAFKMLGTDPGEILRPSTAKSLSVAVSNLLSAGGVTLPKALALEIAPYTLFNSGGLTQEDYVRNRLYYSCRLSLGTAAGTSGDSTTRLGIGLHITPIDDGDLRNDTSYQHAIRQLTSGILRQNRRFEIEFRRQHGLDTTQVVTDPQLAAQEQEYVRVQRDSLFGDTTQRMHDQFQARNWNKQRLDIALGWLQTSPNSSAANARTTEAACWLTYCSPVRDFGELMVGAVGTFHTDPGSYADFAAAVRFYAGINQLKGFVEGQVGYGGLSRQDSVSARLGAEIRIVDAVWADLALGIGSPGGNWPGAHPQLTSNLDLKFTTPKALGLF